MRCTSAGLLTVKAPRHWERRSTQIFNGLIFRRFLPRACIGAPSPSSTAPKVLLFWGTASGGCSVRGASSCTERSYGAGSPAEARRKGTSQIRFIRAAIRPDGSSLWSSARTPMPDPHWARRPPWVRIRRTQYVLPQLQFSEHRLNYRRDVCILHISRYIPSRARHLRRRPASFSNSTCPADIESSSPTEPGGT